MRSKYTIKDESLNIILQIDDVLADYDAYCMCDQFTTDELEVIVNMLAGTIVFTEALRRMKEVLHARRSQI